MGYPEEKIEIEQRTRADGSIEIKATLYTPNSIINSRAESLRRLIAERKAVLLTDGGEIVGAFVSS